MNILGISAYYHDSASALVRDGKIVAAAQEERFTRKKHDPDFPFHATDFCLKEAGLRVCDLDRIVFYDKPWLKFERLLKSYLAYAPRGLASFTKAMPVWLKNKLWTSDAIRRETGFTGEILFTEHHQSHAASAFFPSPFEEAAVLTIDGVGEWATSSIAAGRGNSLMMLSELRFPHSLGLLYSAFTYYTGFKVNSGEYKVMGLAPYGEPKYAKLILEKLMDLREDGSFCLHMEYFNYVAGLTMTNDLFHSLFGGPPRAPESNLSQREMDLAASIQAATEEIMLRMARHARKETGMKHLCLAGGVALNCVGNGRIQRAGIFDRVWVQPAAGDAGGALGAALFAWHQILGNPRHVDGKKDSQRGSLLGPVFSDAEIDASLERLGASRRKLAAANLVEATADLLVQGRVVAWFQGPMEYGPRALGARSILGDPRDPNMQARMNLQIKFRESFRPFAPAVLRDRVADWFDLDADSPYMLLVAPVRADKRLPPRPEDKNLFGIERLNAPRSSIPAVTHVDFSARIQTVDHETNPLYFDLLQAFDRKTGCPVLINTSFNVRGEPIVHTPEEAYTCFMRTNIDALVIGGFLLEKKDQPQREEAAEWMKEFAPD